MQPASVFVPAVSPPSPEKGVTKRLQEMEMDFATPMRKRVGFSGSEYEL